MDLSGYEQCIVISSSYHAKAWERHVPGNRIYTNASEITRIMNTLRDSVNRTPKEMRCPVALIIDPLLRLNIPYIRERVRFTDAVVMVLEPTDVVVGIHLKK